MRGFRPTALEFVLALLLTVMLCTESRAVCDGDQPSFSEMGNGTSYNGTNWSWTGPYCSNGVLQDGVCNLTYPDNKQETSVPQNHLQTCQQYADQADQNWADMNVNPLTAANLCRIYYTKMDITLCLNLVDRFCSAGGPKNINLDAIRDGCIQYEDQICRAEYTGTDGANGGVPDANSTRNYCFNQQFAWLAGGSLGRVFGGTYRRYKNFFGTFKPHANVSIPAQLVPYARGWRKAVAVASERTNPALLPRRPAVPLKVNGKEPADHR